MPRLTFKEMVLEAVKVMTIEDRRRKTSRQIIEKFVFEVYTDVEKTAANRARIIRALLALVESGEVTRRTGRGANGSFCAGPVSKTTAKKGSK